MDVWVVAAATSAGFIAKYWQFLLRNTNSLSSLSHNGSDFERHESPLLSSKPCNKRCPFHIFSRRNKVGSIVSSKRLLSDSHSSESSCLDGAMGLDASCTRDDCIADRPSSVKVVSLRSDNIREYEDASIESDDIGNRIPEFPNWEMSFSRSYRKSRSVRYNRSGLQFLQPVSSIESCLMAQLHRKHAEMEEYVFALHRSLSVSDVSPLFLTDSDGIINRAWDEKRLHKKPSFEGKGTVTGFPPLPTFEFSKVIARVKPSRQHDRIGNGKHLHRKGSIDRSFLFCIGFAIGIISAAISSKREVTKLKEMLINSEDLVVDLQDELEMKNSLSVKEFVDGNFESQNALEHSLRNKTPIAISPQAIKYDVKRVLCEEEEDKAESISNIEAELEAELERLEISMNSSCLKEKLSDRVELDPEVDTGIFQGESLAATVGVIQDSNLEYAVSPRELTLRLHEVIQSRLEERVKELEAALENSQRKLLSMESECIKSSSITLEQSISIEDDYSASGCGRNGEFCDSTPFSAISKQKPTSNASRVKELKEVAGATMSEDGNSDCDDELEKLLIKQIVEKTKNRSPVILNAQRLLFQFDEDQL